MDLCITNKACQSSLVRFKLDMDAVGNMLPYNLLHELFVNVTIKKLCKSVDNLVMLEAYNKPAITQLLLCFGLMHAQCI